jgi:DNA-binding SARP family transcriptional activator/tetratricopeptide (TPR) repeat protein
LCADDGRLLDLGGPRQRRILATLLLHPNQVVEVSVLADAAWDGDPPATAHRLVRNRIAALRAVLIRAGAFIDTEDSGYRLRVGPGELDATVFDELVRQGRAASDPALLREALALWRGQITVDPCGAGAGDLPATAATALEETRVAVVEECVDLEMSLDPPTHQVTELVAELRHLVSAHPLRERLVGHLMLALYRHGRPDEALCEYRRLADRLADELGIDPGPELRRLHDAMRRDDPALLRSVIAAPAAGPAGDPVAGGRPQQLPADVAGFTGRLIDVARLDSMLSDGQTASTVVISAVAGTAGVGKTALAVHWAHRVRDKFPDGQLFVNLRGYARTPPVRPLDALAGFLRALGVAPERVPADLAEASALYQAMVADRRILVVLDNAGDADQIGPLLPAGPGSLAIVTARDALPGLAGGDRVHPFSLGVLAADDAYELLTRLLGDDRVAAEPAAAAELARLCAYLPLALRIAGANLTESETIAGYCTRLATGDRLDALQVDGDEEAAAVRAAFDLSYAALPAPARRLFRLIGLVPGPDVTAEVAAALADTDTDQARHLLDRLAAAHLIEVTVPGRYAFHDLLRLYASEQAADDPDPNAAGRLYDFYARATRDAINALTPSTLQLPLPDRSGGRWTAPGFTGHCQALAWLDAERANLVAAVTSAPDGPATENAWRISEALEGYLYRGAHIVELSATSAATLAAVTAAGELRPQALARMGLAHAALHHSRYPVAIEQMTLALEAARRAGWRHGQSAALHGLGGIDTLIGQARRAADHFAEALAIGRDLGWPAAVARSVAMLGATRIELGELTAAAEHFSEALTLYREVGSTVGEAGTLDNLGHIHLELGDLDLAREHLVASLALMRELGIREGEVDVLRLLAEVDHAAGRPDEAFRYAEMALALARDSGLHRYQALALNVLGELHDDGGDHLLAADHVRQARRLARDTDDRGPELTAVATLARVYSHLGRGLEAVALAEEAVAGAVDCGYRLIEERARVTLAEVCHTVGDTARATTEAERALAISRDTGQRADQVHAAELLDRIGQCSAPRRDPV